ncbi:hypothetical protein FRC07_014510, partial [Ceratobasidium sp. 392]
SESEDDEDSDSDAPRAPTPINYEDTDIGLTEPSVPQASATQRKHRADQWLNLQKPQRFSQSTKTPGIPTHSELQANARQHLADVARKICVRDPPPGFTQQPQSQGHGPLRSWEMTPDQHAVIGTMGYHVYMDVVCINPWPKDRDSFLEDAKDYTVEISGIDGPDVYTPRFMDTVYSKMPYNRGDPLDKMETIVQQEFAISAADKPKLNFYIDDDNFLYPTIHR